MFVSFNNSCFYLFHYFDFFFFNDAAVIYIYTLSLHDALPIFLHFCTYLAFDKPYRHKPLLRIRRSEFLVMAWPQMFTMRSEEHTSELQSRGHLVCRLLLEKKKEKDCEKRMLFPHERLIDERVA